jgi:hypothetical protein
MPTAGRRKILPEEVGDSRTPMMNRTGSESTRVAPRHHAVTRSRPATRRAARRSPPPMIPTSARDTSPAEGGQGTGTNRK